MFAVTFGFLTYYALHHGSYSLIDRQTNAVILWVMIGAGAAFGIFPAVRQPRVAWLPFFALLAMAVWTLIALSWTESDERTINEFARMVGYLGILALLLLCVGRRSWRMAAAGLLAAGVLVCCLTLLSRLWPSLFPVDTVASSFEASRISYPFGYWNAVGCWASMTIALCVAYAAHARSWVVRGLALAAIPVCSCVLYLTLSRAGLGGLVVGVSLAVLLGRNKWLAFGQVVSAAAVSLPAVLVLRGQDQLVNASGSNGSGKVVLALFASAISLGLIAALAHRLKLDRRLRLPDRLGRGLAIAGGVIAVVAGSVLFAVYGGQVWENFKGNPIPSKSSESADARLGNLSGNRYNIYASAVEAFESARLTGRGPGTFEFWWSRNGNNAEYLRDSHSIFLESLAETGAVGFVLLLLFIALAIAAALACWRGMRLRSDSELGIQAGLIAVFTVFLFQSAVDWMWESTAVAAMALAAIAIAFSVDGSTGSVRRTSSGQVGIAVASVTAIFMLLPGLSLERQVERSQAEFQRGNFGAAAGSARKAVDSAPWSASAVSQLALAQLELGDSAAAKISVDEAMRLEPFNWRWPLIGMQIAVAEGDSRAAAASYRKAIELQEFSKLLQR